MAYPCQIPCRFQHQSLPEDIDGKSIIPTLLGNAAEQKRHEYLYREWDRGWLQWAVRHGRWRLVSDGRGQWHVFDLETDLSEANDSASEHPGLIANADEWVAANRTDPSDH